MPYDPQDLISTARKRLKEAQSAEEYNREQTRIDLEFLTLQQWSESVKTAREQQNPPRPCVVSDRLTAFWNQVTNEVRKAQPSPRVAPRGGGATKETAEVIEGKVRQILYDSDSQLAFTEAAKYAIGSSIGAFELDAEIVNPDTGQQELRVLPIYDPSTIYWDPFAKRPDKSDARWCIQLTVMSRIAFEETWPDSDAAQSNFVSKDQDIGEWMDPGGDKESIMVAAYWCVETVDDAVALGDDDENPGAPKGNGKKKKRVMRHMITGSEELEKPTTRPGEWIPIFPVEGNSLWVNGKRYTSSLIRGARDPQRILNWQETKMLEMLAVQSTAPYWLTPKQAQNHEKMLQNAPNQNYFYLPFNPDPENPGPPTRQNAEAPIAELAQSIAMKTQEIKDIIGLQDPNLGKAQYANQSGFAVQQLRTEGDTATYHFTDNLSRTLKHFCRVLMAWIPFYYDLEQDLLILKADMTEDQVQINTPQPVQGPNGQPYQHNFKNGNYQCVVEIGTAYDTARQEEAALYGQIIQANPEAFWVIGDLPVRAMDSPGSDEAADRIKRAIALRMPGLIPDENGQLPPQATQQIQQMQAQLQQLQQLVQQQALEIKTRVLPKQIEAQSRMQLEHVRSQTAIATALLDLKGKIHAATLQHGHAMYDTNLREATDAVEHLMSMLHESELAPSDPSAGGLHPQPPPLPPAAMQGKPQ